jgi:hypothetical protein
MAYLGIPQNTIAVLQKYHFNFQKKFGQNFLIDTTVLDRIISSDDAGHLCKSGEMTVQAAYALWGNKQGDDCIFFLGGGTLLKTPHVEISSLTVTDVMLVYKEGVWKYAASAPCKIRMNGKEYNLLPDMIYANFDINFLL